jgi:CBS-domain-containing membrane protein
VSIISPEFRHYIFQTTVLFIALSIAFMAGSVASNEAIIVAAMGPTSFILFITPRNPSADARHTLLGHSLGLLIGSVVAIASEGQMAQSLLSTYAPYLSVTIAAMAVALNVLLMGITRTGHAPATATTLVVIVNGFSWSMVLQICISIAVLCIFYQLLKTKIYNLV